MSSRSSDKKKKTSGLSWIIRILLFVSGIFLIIRNKKKLYSVVKNRNFIVTLAYTIAILFSALLYRLLMVVNWIIQQGAR
jgi:hypothetical protein